MHGNIRCKDCHGDQMAQDEQERRNAHSHAIASSTMEFDQDGAPTVIRVNTHCQWGGRAELDMIDGRAVYVLMPDKTAKAPNAPTPLHYDPDRATCERCQRNGNREMKKRELREQQENARNGT